MFKENCGRSDGGRMKVAEGTTIKNGAQKNSGGKGVQGTQF